MTCREIAEGALIERYLAGRLPDAVVEAFEAHYLTCGRCQTELELAAAIREGLAQWTDPSQAASVDEAADGTATQQGARPRTRRLKAAGIGAVAVAAGIVAVLTVRSAPPSPEPLEHRDEPLDVPRAPATQMPTGDVTEVTTFRWSPVPAADLYRVRVFDAEGSVVWEAETRSSDLVAPAELRFTRDAQYLWEVEARVGFDRWVSSALVRFRVTGR